MKLWRYGLAIERLGQRYRLDGVLGSGGMADVCLAWDERDEREVAVKVIKPDELNQRSLDRFLKEASHVARWRHPHILRIYGDVHLELLDVTQGSIVPYIVMEYARGGDLHKRLQPPPNAWMAGRLIRRRWATRARISLRPQYCSKDSARSLPMIKMLPAPWLKPVCGSRQALIHSWVLAIPRRQHKYHFYYRQRGSAEYCPPGTDARPLGLFYQCDSEASLRTFDRWQARRAGQKYLDAASGHC